MDFHEYSQQFNDYTVPLKKQNITSISKFIVVIAPTLSFLHVIGYNRLSHKFARGSLSCCVFKVALNKNSKLVQNLKYRNLDFI